MLMGEGEFDSRARDAKGGRSDGWIAGEVGLRSKARKQT